MNQRSWNSTLPARKTPLRSKKGFKRKVPTCDKGIWPKGRSGGIGKSTKALKRTPLKQVSQKQRRRHDEYMPVQRAYLKDHPNCEVCIARKQEPLPATEVHHLRGRNGRLLCDTRFFKASCFYCRLWPHENPVEARAVGMLAEASDWGVFPESEK